MLRDHRELVKGRRYFLSPSRSQALVDAAEAEWAVNEERTGAEEATGLAQQPIRRKRGRPKKPR